MNAYLERLPSNDLSLRKITFTEDDEYYLCDIVDALKENTTVIELDFNLMSAGVGGAICVAKMLKRNHAVQTLRMLLSSICDEGAIEIAQMLKENTIVTRLDLSWNEIGKIGVAALVESLKYNATLQHLMLTTNHIGSASAIKLANMLKKNKTLRTLDLSRNYIDSIGVRALAGALVTNATITSLTLRENSFSNKIRNGWRVCDTPIVSKLLKRNALLEWSITDKRIQLLFIGLHAALGNDVYTNLLIVDHLPYIVLLNRARKVALLQMLV